MTVLNAAPVANLTGINDQSIRSVPPARDEIPMHLPYVHLFTERGPLDVVMAVGADRSRIYGADSFDYSKKWANHSTVLANTVNDQGNLQMIRRVVHEDAAPARIGLFVERVVDDIPVYRRNLDGSYELDVDGKRILVNGVPSETGSKLRWFTDTISKETLFGSAVSYAGAMVGNGSAPSTIYPIMELETQYGSFGNNVGFRLYAPTTKSASPANESVITDQEAYLYRMQFVERVNSKSSATTATTINGGQYVEFAFKEGIINRKLQTELGFDRVVLPSYRSVDPTSGFSPIYGPIENIHVYQDNITTLTDALFADEFPMTDKASSIMNIFNHTDWNGIPYNTYEVVGPIEDGLLMSETTTHFLQGGADGNLDFTTFDRLVGDTIANFENDSLNLMDSARFPMSVIYDSGYGIETKKKLFIPMGLRKDIAVISATQDVSLPQNTIAEDSSMGIALRTAARMFPESVLFGTATARAVTIGHSGYLVNSKYKGLVPMTIDFASKCAKFMGAANGVMKDNGYDVAPNNQVTMLRDVNNTYKNERVRNKDWDAGLVWVQNFDTRSLFYPAVQTVYDEDTSVLNSAINMQIAVELEKVCERVWRLLTGNSKLTNAQFIERSDELITAQTLNRFNDRVVVVPETFLTVDDSLRGYSWSCNVHMYGNNMKTVGTFTVVAQRREDLNNG